MDLKKLLMENRTKYIDITIRYNEMYEVQNRNMVIEDIIELPKKNNNGEEIIVLRSDSSRIELKEELLFLPVIPFAKDSTYCCKLKRFELEIIIK